ncbi:hypothetical protein HY604_03465 [Candidatus Peregrinibacteria bacterium]|nr:hypothetical protein [Candidatus Peregrinibacteria bacterium]
MELKQFAQKSLGFKQNRLVFQDAGPGIERAPSAPDTKSQLRVLSLSIIMAMKNGGNYTLEKFENWSQEKQDEHYRKLAGTMPQNFKEELFFSSRNPYLQELESNVILFAPAGMTTDDIANVETQPDGSANVNFKNAKQDQWIKFEAQHTVIKAIKWMEDQLKNEPNPTKEQVEVVVGTIRQLKKHEGKVVDELFKDEEEPEKETGPIKPEEHAAIHKEHAKFHETTYKTPEKVTEVITKDRETLSKANVKDIRQKNQLLVEGKAETNDQKRSYLKEETARRLRAYCDIMQNGWFKLDYSRVGGNLHQQNIGLGDLLLDPDIDAVEIRTRKGKIIHAHRGIVESGKYKGRIGFLDDKTNAYADTYDNDLFRIKSETSAKTEDYIQKIENESKARETHEVTIETGTGARSRGNIEQEIKDSPITYKAADTKINGSNLTVGMIQEAEKEAATGTHASTKTKAMDEVLERNNFMEVVNYAAKHVGVPPWVILSTMFHEARFNYNVKNKEGDEERGIGQFKKAAWISTRADESFISTMEQAINEDSRTMERQRSLLADTMAVAITIKRALTASGDPAEFSYSTDLTSAQLEKIRWFYHVPSYFRCIQKEGRGYSAQFYEKAKAFLRKTQARENHGDYGYKDFADTALLIRDKWRAKFDNK